MSRYRLLIALCVSHVLLLIPALILIRYSVNAVYNAEIRDTLRESVKTSENLGDVLINRLKQEARHITRLLIAEPDFMRLADRYFRKRATEKDWTDFQRSLIHTKFLFDGIYLFDANKQQLTLKKGSLDAIVRTLVRDSTIVQEALYGRPWQAVSVPDRGVITVEPVLLSDETAGALLTVMSVPASVTEAYEYRIYSGQAVKTLLKDLKKSRRNLWIAGMIILVAICALQITGIIIFWKRYTKPIDELRSGLEALTRGQRNFNVDAASYSEEYKMIAAHIDHLIKNFSQQQSRLIYLEKMALWRDIARQLAHEIKNPLTPIQLTIQQIRDSYHGDDTEYKKVLTECSRIILEEIQRLRSLTKEFSDFARAPNLIFRSNNLNTIIGEVIQLYKSKAIYFNPDDRIPDIEVDRDAIKQVLINLLDNAIESAPKEITVTITTANLEDHVSLVIRDNGKGIPKEYLSRIFEPYYTTKASGAGLGLAIVKNILEEHRATIEADSIENLGTTFTILFRKLNPLLS